MIKIPKIVEAYYPELIWRIPTDEKNLYLTFDDGPTPSVTTWILKTLKEYNAKATFFCLGRNVRNHPIIFKNILKDGHSVGNHTYDHRNGWNSKNYDYLRNVVKCADWIDSDLFRPPYGRIKKAQIRGLKGRFRIVMWDVLSEDYNSGHSPEKCIQIVEKQARNGSIIVFHDSRKAARNMMAALPQVLRHFSEEGYRFRAIS